MELRRLKIAKMIRLRLSRLVRQPIGLVLRLTSRKERSIILVVLICLRIKALACCLTGIVRKASRSSKSCCMHSTAFVVISGTW